jgi:hypothetical protein
MKKALLYMFAIGTTIVAIGTIIFLVFTFWEKILSGLSAGARAASNIINQITDDKTETDDYGL